MPETPSNFREFDAQPAADSLGSQPRAMHDIAHGDGEALDVGDTVVEVYPDAGFTRVTTPDARIELFRVFRYDVREQQVVFEQGPEDNRTRLLVGGDGKVSFRPLLRATETPRTREPALSGHRDSPNGRSPSETTTGASTTPEDQEQGEVEPLQLRGRLGRDPWFATRDDRHAAGFPLAVNSGDDGKATWHNVVTFDEPADQLHKEHSKGVIRRGRLVDVTGQPVVVEQPKPTGGVKKSTEFHASTITRVTSRTVPVRRGH